MYVYFDFICYTPHAGGWKRWMNVSAMNYQHAARIVYKATRARRVKVVPADAASLAITGHTRVIKFGG